MQLLALVEKSLKLWEEYLYCGREFWHLEVFVPNMYIEVFVST